MDQQDKEKAANKAQFSRDKANAANKAQFSYVASQPPPPKKGVSWVRDPIFFLSPRPHYFLMLLRFLRRSQTAQLFEEVMKTSRQVSRICSADLFFFARYL